MSGRTVDGKAGDVWRTSKWVRHYDWDWSSEPPHRNQEEFAAAKAAILPVHFYYHVLRSFRVERVEGSDDWVRVKYVNDGALVDDMLNAFRTPMRFVDYMRASTAGSSAVTQTFRTLRDQGLIVPASSEEPPDWLGAFEAAVCLYGNFQIDEEMVAALEFLATRPPKTYVEIGTAWGGSLFCWAQVADPAAHLVSVDLPGGVGGGGYAAHHVRHYKQFCQDGQRLSCVMGDSGSPEVLAEVRRLTVGETIDVLFIDGDHTYAGVKRDFEMYSPLVQPGGLIMFHDIMPAPHHPECIEVDRLWNELKQRYAHKEFVQDPMQEGSGIGVLCV